MSGSPNEIGPAIAHKIRRVEHRGPSIKWCYVLLGGSFLTGLAVRNTTVTPYDRAIEIAGVVTAEIVALMWLSMEVISR